MGLVDVLKLAGGMGPTIALLALILAIGVGIGILIFTVKGLSGSLLAQSETFERSVRELKESSDKRDEKLEQLIAEQGLRIQYIETRFASKEDMYEALGGWKHEVSELRKRIDRYWEHSKGGSR
jgi:uncharacterized protein HemX